MMNHLVKMMAQWKANVILNVLKSMADLYEWLSLPLAIFQKKVFLTTKSNPFCTVMISKYLVSTFTLFFFKHFYYKEPKNTVHAFFRQRSSDNFSLFPLIFNTYLL